MTSGDMFACEVDQGSIVIINPDIYEVTGVSNVSNVSKRHAVWCAWVLKACP